MKPHKCIECGEEMQPVELCNDCEDPINEYVLIEKFRIALKKGLKWWAGQPMTEITKAATPEVVFKEILAYFEELFPAPGPKGKTE